MNPKRDKKVPKMATVEFFCQDALRTRIAPPSVGSVKDRIRKSAILLGWSYTRTKDAWYAAPRMIIRPEELFRVEAVSGLEYARQELRKNDAAIERATALLAGEDTHLIRTLVAALFSAIGLRDRA